MAPLGRPGRSRADVWAGVLNATGENIFNSWLAGNSRARVNENLGGNTFAYVGVQGMDNLQMSVWIFTIYGGLRLSGDPEAPHEQVSKVGVLIASKELIERFNAMLAGGSPSWFRRAWLALRRILVHPRRISGSVASGPTLRRTQDRSEPDGLNPSAAVTNCSEECDSQKRVRINPFHTSHWNNPVQWISVSPRPVD